MATGAKKFIGEGLKDSGPNKNVLNVLRLLIEDEKSIVYMPTDYQRGVRKRVDEHVHPGVQGTAVALPIQDFVPHMERFNFSVRGLKEVFVEDEETGKVEPRKVFRTYNVIRDGELHITELSAKLSEESYVELVSAGILYDQRGKQVDGENLVYNPDYVYTIKLEGLPLVSTHWANPTKLRFIENLMNEQYLSELVKVLNRIEKNWRQNLLGVDGKPVVDQESDIYVERSTKYAEDEPKDYVEATCVLYRVKSGEVKALLKENANQTTLEHQYESYDEVRTALTHHQKQLKKIRFLLRAVAFSIENTKKQGSFDWSEPEKLPRSKNKMVQRTQLDDDLVLERITWTEQVPK